MKIVFLLLLSLLPSLAYCAETNSQTNRVLSVYQPLLDHLSKEGFDLEFLSTVFSDDRAEVIPDRMIISLSSKEDEDWYTPFLNPDSILLAKNFLTENLKFLKNVEKRSKVDKEVIVSILLVESRFGENTGRHRVIPTLASMAVIDTMDNVQNNYLILRGMDPELSYDWVEERAKRRANWAYHELKCFLRIIKDEKIDPLEIRGSYAGAIGMPQFMPSSYIAFAVSQRGFENWLLSKEDAVLSIANYLKLHGWKKNMPMVKKRNILWYYNHSEPYIQTILKVAQKLKKK